MKKLKNKVIVITGGSRGIGLAIALRLAADGAKIAILAKTDQLNPKLPGTIFTAAKAIVEAGGKALPIKCDIRDEKQVADAFAQVICEFDGIDVLINNASAISLTDTTNTDMKRFDLMQAVNGRGTYLCSKLAIPHLRNSKNPHILTLSPPLNLNPQWFASHLAYTISKYTMSM
ncbi:MAG: SDR family oxidoreductase, partial [Cyanobacteria bacterium HKST-UBA01]|nr:SDR family oxidoreductase [Cyanobacteria bacterium HKST-UBA01]